MRYIGVHTVHFKLSIQREKYSGCALIWVHDLEITRIEWTCITTSGLTSQTLLTRHYTTSLQSWTFTTQNTRNQSRSISTTIILTLRSIKEINKSNNSKQVRIYSHHVKASLSYRWPSFSASCPRYILTAF